MKSARDLLCDVPDWNDSFVERWIAQVPVRASALGTERELVSVSGADLPDIDRASAVRSFASATFRRFVIALLAADLAVYGSPADMVDIERLAYVVAKYAEGFRLWCSIGPDGCVPVGYAGFYPISEQSFERLATGTPPLEDRFLHPVRPEPNPLLYIFNYSIVPGLRRSAGHDGGAELVRQLDAELRALNPRGLATITVSPDGARVASRWNLVRTATFVFEGEREHAYTWRRSL